MSVTQSNSHRQATVDLFNQYCDGFEATFEYTTPGTLRCDLPHCATVQAWFNANLLNITLASGVDVQPVRFGNSAPTNAMQMTSCYSLAYTAYLNYCKTLRRDPAAVSS